MFATMVVCLPSEHQGGTVVLKHNKDDYTFDSARGSDFGTSFAAWYSDVYHEVQRITGGRRLVLTYNLVQQGSSPVQKAPDNDGNQQLAKALQDYDKALDLQKNDFWPTYLVYKLGHTYSQASLALRGLKGKDEARVRRLGTVAEKTGFHIYLGMFEKVIHKDDYCGDEEIEREGSLKYIHDLSGKAIDVQPWCGKDNMLDNGNATDDEEPDDEEHTGWTGNEGAPAEYFYRDSVVLIVPQCRRVDFRVNDNGNNYLTIQRTLREFTSRNIEKGSYDFWQLARLIDIVAKKQSTSNGYRDPYLRSDEAKKQYKQQKQRCLEEIVVVALGWDLSHILDRIPHEFRLASRCLEAFGSFMLRHGGGVDSWAIETEKMLKTVTGVAKPWEALESIQRGLESGAFPEGQPVDEESPESAAISWNKIFVARVVRKWLTMTTNVRKSEATAFADMLWKYAEYDPEIEKAVVSLMQHACAPTMVGFIVALASYLDKDDLRKHKIQRLLQDSLAQLWPRFEFETVIRGEVVRSRYGPPGIIPAIKDVLTAQDLVELLLVCQQVGDPTQSTLTALVSFQAALTTSTSSYAKDNLFSFLTPLIKRSIPSLCASLYQTVPVHEAVKNFLAPGLTFLIHKYIQPEPQRSTVYSLPRGSCSCSDCDQVNSFLASESRTVFDLSCAKNRQAHLNAFFTDSGRGTYKIETIRHTNPNVWRITKTFDQIYQVKHEQWAERVKWLEAEMRSLADVQNGWMCKELLGEETFEGLMTCTVEGLQKKCGKQELAELSGNARKRKAEDEEVDALKKSRGMNRPADVEVLDLT